MKHSDVLALLRYIMCGTFESGNIDAICVPNVFIFPLDVTRKLEWNVEQFELLYTN